MIESKVRVVIEINFIKPDKLIFILMMETY